MIDSNGTWVIALTFILAFILAVMPVPAWLVWARPEWVMLVLIYWVLALPHRVGLGVAFIVGLLQDALLGVVLGVNTLSLLVVAYICLMLYQRMRNYSLWQQAGLVFILVGLGEMLARWLESFSNHDVPTLQFLLSSLCSALIWPWFMLSMRALRRRFRVS
ncbi:rod shape-determining protein MreD [Sinobacterium caligoides]|uniref:Rod shape-determining protein MreD n=1 Tax=Sinobacterium caligoides TaxID=933926 RepID=A0A3N2DN60_9GAMM|nr:rod shape-determining protein MreD [Sinobacterium caligoides]ROS01241.1 rod shape-determining protein MreD [Sinobacterium caligoides]